ncbi:MAG: ribonuclease III family protein [Bacteroidia bacterium]
MKSLEIFAAIRGKQSLIRTALPSHWRVPRQVGCSLEIKGQKSEPLIFDNERLEFLGDAVLDSSIAHLLFLRFPYKDEGFLTEMRTRIVNREQLGNLASRLGLTDLMDIHSDLRRNRAALKNIGGNALEALIGALFIDKGYAVADRFVRERLVDQYLDVEKLMETTVSYKAILLKWIQKNKMTFEFQLQPDPDKPDLKNVSLWVDGAVWFTERNANRKKAEELCCEKAVRKLDLPTH